MERRKLKLTIVGGGSTYTPALMKTLCDFKDELPLEQIILYDINEERQKLVGEYGEVLFRELYPELKVFKYTMDKKEAFENIDFALMQIRTGGMKMREKDEKIPLKYGCVGQETCGAGGFAYGLRSVKDVIELVNDIRVYSKDAWILNYSNPAAIVAEAAKKLLPNEKKLINICDMPIAMMESYASALGKKRQQLSPRYFGLNHFGWFTNLYDEKGVDLLPKLKNHITNTEVLPKDVEMLDESWKQTFRQLTVMTKDFPEYLPNTYLQYYLYPEKMVKKSDPNYTRANEVMAGRETKGFDKLRKIVEAGTIKGADIDSGVHGSYIVELATALAYNESKIFLIITENKGAIANFSYDAMVEVACLVGANGPEPLRVGDVPTFYKGLLENQFAYEKLTIEAYIEGSYDKALQALTLNRTIGDAVKARLILDELIEANKDFWPVLK